MAKSLRHWLNDPALLFKASPQSHLAVSLTTNVSTSQHSTSEQILTQAIADWQADGIITPQQAEAMRRTLPGNSQPRQQLARYFVIIAVSAALLACGAFFLDEKLLERLRKAFLLANATIAIGAGALAALLLWYARTRRRRVAPATYELYLLPAAVALLIALVYACKDWPADAHAVYLTGFCAVAYGALAVAFSSRLLWGCAVLALCGWFGQFSEAYSHNGLFLGMGYPARYALFGVVLLGVSEAQRRVARLQPARRITWHVGILACFTGLWGLSVFGNFADLDAWQAVRQAVMLPYAIVTGLLLGGALYAGIRRDDRPLRDYALAFLLLHLYTRYFEYFWDGMSKGLFFLVLAASFGALAWWLMRRARTTQP